MKLKIFKSIALLAICLVFGASSFAHGIAAHPDSIIIITPGNRTAMPFTSPIVAPVIVTVKTNKELTAQLQQLKKQCKTITITSNAQVAAILKNLNVNINNMYAAVPQVANGVKPLERSSVNYSYQQDDNQRIKNYTKIYSVNASDKLMIENRYGRVTVNTWPRNEIRVDVQIKVSAGNSEDSQKLLDYVNISDSKEGSLIAFKTNIGQGSDSWTTFMHSSGPARRMEINYTVYMPSKNDLSIDNRYGMIELPDMDGKITINSAYGGFIAKSLTNQSDINVKYGNANIGNLGASELVVAYGRLTLGSAGKLDADVSYSAANIGQIHTSGVINLKYSGGLRITDVDKNMKSLAINSSYSNVNVGLSGDENANFDVTVHYGGFNYDDHNATIISKTPDDNEHVINFTKNYKGYLGKGKSDKTIAINSNYGSVKFE
jgi:hypothetical protein